MIDNPFVTNGYVGPEYFCASPDFDQALLDANVPLGRRTLATRGTQECLMFNVQYSITDGKGSDIFALTLNG